VQDNSLPNETGDLFAPNREFAASCRELPAESQLHVHYAETVLPVSDGLPKLKDFPAEMGGSGEIIAE
jgi:hypothetical protein